MLKMYIALPFALLNVIGFPFGQKQPAFHQYNYSPTIYFYIQLGE